MKKQSLPISLWAAEDKPSYKIETLGTHSLSNTELLSIVIGSGSNGANAIEVARNILAANNNSLKRLMANSKKELSKMYGIGEQKASKVLAALELGKRVYNEDNENEIKIDSAFAVYNYMHPYLFGLDTEEFWVLFCNQNFKLIKAKKMFAGGLTEVVVDLRLIMKEALLCNATILFCVHNHPSGRLIPSMEDDKLTMRLKKASETMRMYFPDHVIFTDTNYYSYKEQGKI